MSTFEELESHLRSILEDSSGARFSDDLLASAVRQALARMDECLPLVLSAEISVTSSGRDQPLSGLTNCIYLIHILYPFSDAAELQPDVQFTYSLQSGIPVVHFNGTRIPQAGEVLRVEYAAQNTLEGLDGAETTTLSAAAESALINGAAGHACWLRAGGIAHAFGIKTSEPALLMETGRLRLDLFERTLQGLKVLQEFGFPPGFKMDRWDRNRRSTWTGSSV